jgi:hypothetical protein
MSLTTPDRIRNLQRKLYGKAKAEPTKRSKPHGRGTRAFSQDKVFGELGVKRLMRWGSESTSTALP